MKGAFRVFESGEAAVIVAGDKQSQGGAELVGVSREAAAFAVESGHIATQVGISALDGVGLLFTRCHIVACPAFTLPVDQLLVSGKSIAVELMHLGHQRKHAVHQRLHRFQGAFFDHIPSEDTPCFAIDNGGYREETGRMLFVFFSPVVLFFLARLALQKV